ncbi:hypothetical protein DRJ17_05070 [Candidatus Woesearchaeota archaeon]|nr:MAG: hypothetical protein DRJ17_05070 [Candidatus Woesearchaeota archaeon]
MDNLVFGRGGNEYTLEELRKKFTINIPPDANSVVLVRLNAELTSLIQEANFELALAESELSKAEELYNAVNSDMEIDYHKALLAIAKEQLSRPKSDRLSVAEKESAARTITASSSDEDLKKAAEEVNRLTREIKIWKHIMENLRFVGERLQQLGYLINNMNKI